MFDLTRIQINKIADTLNFNRNMTEKVLRLYTILEFIDSGRLKELLVLKGGTAINLFLLDLPRLSIDIDLDFNLACSKEEMQLKREFIDRSIKGFMLNEGYSLSSKSKFYHSLDSYVYSYITASGSIDILKIEINYSNRVHVLKPMYKESTDVLDRKVFVYTMSDDELIGSKLNALIVRTTPRDVFDIFTLIENGCLYDIRLIRKIALFYICLGTNIPVDLEVLVNNAIRKIESLNYAKIKETLIPVLHKQNALNIEKMETIVIDNIKNIFSYDHNDLLFVNNFNSKLFRPDILFEDYNVNDLSNHPMGIWKTK